MRIAHLARRPVRHFADQAHYVMAICLRPRPWGHDRSVDRSLAQHIQARLHFDCLIIVVARPTPSMLKACPCPIYQASI